MLEKQRKLEFCVADVRREDSDWKQNLGSILQGFVCLINNSSFYLRNNRKH